MRKKKLATYAVALALAAAAMTGVTTRTAHAEEAVQVVATETDAAGIQETEATVESQTAEETTEAAVEADEVAVAEEGNSYYNITTDGGTWNGNQYVLNGQTMINTFFCDGTYTYYLQADGTPMKDRLTYHPDGEHVIYFDADGHEVFSDFANVKKSIAGDPVDDMCFFDVYGYMYVNQLTFDKSGEKIYFVNEYGVIEKGKWVAVNGAKYFDQDYNIYDQHAYAQEDGTLMRDTFTYWNGNQVYLQGDGMLASGMCQIGGVYYLFDPTDGHIIQASATHPDTYTLINGEYIETYNKNDDLLTRDRYDSNGVLRFHYEASYNAAGKMIDQKSVRTDEQGGTHTEELVYNDMGDTIKIVDIMDHYLWLGTYNWTYSDIMEYSYTYYPSGNKSYCKTKTYWNDKLTGEGETYYNDDAENSVSDSNWVDYD